ncbi:hypothetical protein [Algicola sagamiensis]|uniref:hypothetical protein n=1 Tax=Algicola sagamiensis TaxID=163869 RepID=UPI00038011EE|nr:hypothetical protein [Algicola sagamiensis]
MPSIGNHPVSPVQNTMHTSDVAEVSSSKGGPKQVKSGMSVVNTNLSLKKARQPEKLSQRSISNALLEKTGTLPTDPAQKKAIHQSAALANFPYHRDLSVLNEATDGQWTIEKTMVSALGQKFGLKSLPQEGLLLDPKSGLVAFVFHNKEANEVRLVFGGTTSGENTGDLMQRSQSNFASTMRQWGANIKNALLGKTPTSYQQAKEIAKALDQMMKQDRLLQGNSLSISGHSKGGGEAAYAAAMLSTPENPIKAECFCSAELGHSMLKEVKAHLGADGSEEKMREAKQALSGIQHYKVRGDAIPNMHRALFCHDLTHIGNSMTIPHSHFPDKPDANGTLGYHDRFYDHITAWAK